MRKIRDQNKGRILSRRSEYLLSRRTIEKWKDMRDCMCTFGEIVVDFGVRMNCIQRQSAESFILIHLSSLKSIKVVDLQSTRKIEPK